MKNEPGRKHEKRKRKKKKKVKLTKSGANGNHEHPNRAAVINLESFNGIIQCSNL